MSFHRSLPRRKKEGVKAAGKEEDMSVNKEKQKIEIKEDKRIR